MFKKILGISLAAALAMGCGAVQAESITTTLTKVAELPISGSQGFQTSPQSPRGGILQVDNKLWFTTYSGGENSVGAIVSYNLTSGAFVTEHSFGLPDPAHPASARYDGYNPWKTTLTLGADGLIYYATQYGGASWTAGSNGGAIGSFNPNTVQSAGVTVLWSGQTGASAPSNLGYTNPIYISGTGGTASLYFNTYAGGTSNWGTVQKLSLSPSGTATGVTQLVQLTGSNSNPNTGRQTQGGLLNVEGKLYYSTATASGGALPTLQVIDTVTGAVTVLSTNWTTGGSNGGWNTPVYDAERNAIYSVALSGGILKWDLTTGVTNPQSLLPNSSDGLAGNFSNPIIFGESLYYVKQNTSGDNVGGSIWRYDLETQQISLLYNLKDFGGKASWNSGSLGIVTVDGISSLYFTTADDTVGDSLGALFRLDITQLAVPEPGTMGLCAAGFALVAWRYRRRQ